MDWSRGSGRTSNLDDSGRCSATCRQHERNNDEQLAPLLLQLELEVGAVLLVEVRVDLLRKCVQLIRPSCEHVVGRLVAVAALFDLLLDQ